MGDVAQMEPALSAYLARARQGGTHHEAVVAAAEAVADDPWAVVTQAGRLARARQVVADRTCALTARLKPVEPTHRGAVVRIEAGDPYPTFDGLGRRQRGAYDTPAPMARAVVRAALDAADGTVRTARDTACGTGAFLVALAEAGVARIEGSDLDPTALAVARIACPGAVVEQADALEPGPRVDVVVGNPPFVPPERQSGALRAQLRARFPWLSGRFDLVVPFAGAATERVRHGGGLGLVMPFASFVQPYGAALRRRWVAECRITNLAGPEPFPGVAVPVGRIALQVGTGPAPVPPAQVAAEELLRLPVVPLSPRLAPGDVALVEGMRANAVPLGDLCVVDTGLVAHSPEGGKARLLRDGPGAGRVPYADARDFFAGTHRWICYAPARMHRPKSPELFERPKIVIQRLRGQRPVRAAVDRRGIYVGHTCTVVQPRDPDLDLDRLLTLVQSPLVDGLTRIERGHRLDLYPHDVAAIPVPLGWLAGAEPSLERAFGLAPADAGRLCALAANER